MPRNRRKHRQNENNLGGRPLEYTKEKGDLICERIATHAMGLKRLCKMYRDMPAHSTVRHWQYKIDAFRDQYAHAKMIQADLLAEECLEIADDTNEDIKFNQEGKKIVDHEVVNRSRLKIDTRKWLASKLLPKQYGDKLLLEQKTEENEKLKAELVALRERLNEENKKDF